MTQAEQDRIDAIRYRWLRDNPRKAYYKAAPFDAPYVIDPKKSRLYAIYVQRGLTLDHSIDEDRQQDMAQHVFEEMLVEGDARFADPLFKFSDEFADECDAKARVLLEKELNIT